MNIVEQTFGRKKVLLPVIHVRDEMQALDQVAIAAANGADGAFLINHNVSPHRVQDAFSKVQPIVKKWHPNFLLGVNLLGVPAGIVLQLMQKTHSLIWSDDAAVDENFPDHSPARFNWMAFKEYRESSFWSGLYFGGVAFKYQDQPRDLALVAKIATRYMDVVTTSGEATGQPPSVDKIRIMREAMGDHPLAIASGVAIGNVVEFLPHTDCFLVSTSISKNFHELDPSEVRDLAYIIHTYD